MNDRNSLAWNIWICEYIGDYKETQLNLYFEPAF